MPPGPKTKKTGGGDERAARGKAGEELAAVFLESRGYTILERNYRSRYGEIDLIVSKPALIAFVEVKTRRSRQGQPCCHGKPFEAVDARKQRQIRNMASMWLAVNSGSPAAARCSFRFDVISINLSDNGPADILHIEDAFR